MNWIVGVYIAAGIAALFFGNITNDLLALGWKGEVINIIEKALTAAVTGIGTVALTRGITLPPIPKKDEVE